MMRRTIVLLCRFLRRLRVHPEELQSGRLRIVPLTVREVIARSNALAGGSCERQAIIACSEAPMGASLWCQVALGTTSGRARIRQFSGRLVLRRTKHDSQVLAGNGERPDWI